MAGFHVFVTYVDEAWQYLQAQLQEKHGAISLRKGSKQLIHIHFTYACYNPSSLA